MSDQTRRKSSRIADGAQMGWEFEPRSVSEPVDSIPRYATTPRALLFDDPDPQRLFIGGSRLQEYLRQQGLTDVFEFRRLLSLVDWSPFELQYIPGGRPPFHPRVMVGLVLFGITQGKSSLRELELLAASDVRCWWITGGLCPDHSAIGNFLNRHREHLTEAFFEELTGKILQTTGSDSSRVANDGTVIESMSSRMRKLKKEAADLRAADAAARAKHSPEDRDIQREAEQAAKEAEAVERRIKAAKKRGHKIDEAVTCPTDPDAAVNQTKRHKTYKPSYVASVLANEDRIVTAQTVEPTSETEPVASLIEQSERVSGQQVDELLQDGGYFCAAMAVLCMTQDINWLCPSGRVEKNALSKPKKKYTKDDFRYDQQRDQYCCPAGQVLIFETESKDSSFKGYRRYRCQQCGVCSYRSQCTTDSRGRSIKRYREDELLEAECEVMSHPKARSRYRQRKAMVEPVFAEQRYIQGLHRFRRRGLDGVKLEYSLHSAAHNVRRYLVLVEASRSASGAEAALAAKIALVLRELLWSLRASEVTVRLPVCWRPLTMASPPSNFDTYHRVQAA